MINLILSILCSTFVQLLFKVFEKQNIRIFHVIIINYAIAFMLGLIAADQGGPFNGHDSWQAPWLLPAIFIGIGFIVMFFVIGISTQKAGIAVTTISTRMSVVIPIVFSILFYHETVTILKVSSVVLALTALVCSVIKTSDDGIQNRYVYLPVMLFFGMGFLHLAIKIAQQTYVSDSQSGAFTGTCFFIAFVSGVVLSFVRRVSWKTFFKKDVLLAGIILGACNFGTVFFLVNALNQEVFDSSVIFGINATGIVACSVLAAALIFKERFSKVNWIGVALSMVSLILLFQT